MADERSRSGDDSLFPGLLIIFFAISKRSPRLLQEGAAAVALGACLASFYLLPAVYEQKWVDIGERFPRDHAPPITSYSFTRQMRITTLSTA